MAELPHRFEKTFFWMLLGTLIVAFLWLLSPFFSVILFSLVLALTIEPLFSGFLKLFRGRRILAALVCLLLAFFIMAVPFGFVVTLITNQLLKITQTFHWDPSWYQQWLGEGRLALTIESWRQTLGIEAEVGTWIKESLGKTAEALYQFSPKVVSQTANFVLQAIFTFFLTYFFLVDGPKLLHEILDLSPLKEQDEQTLAKEMHLTLKACIYGYILTALVQAILAAIGFWIAGIEIFPLLGVATFIMAFVPILGAASVWVPTAIYLFSTSGWGWGIFMAIFGTVLISGVDNILKPILIQGKTKIHPILLFLVIVGGLKLWGPIGLLAGPVLVAVLLATLRIYKRDFR